MKSVRRHLAYNLMQLRRRRSMTQDALAQLAGVPRSTIAHIESGEGNPTLMNLARISTALQVSIEELLSAPRADCKLIKGRDLACVRRSQGNALIFKLLPDPIPGMLIDRMEIEAGCRLGGVPHVSGTKEYLTCMDGEVTVYVAGERYRVQAGDVLAFPGDQAHSYHNTGSKRAVCLSVVTLAPAGV